MRTTLLLGLAVAATVLTGCGGGKTAAQSLTIRLTDDGCSPATAHAKSGPLTVRVESGGSGRVSELELKSSNGIILGERENVVAGISGSFTLDLQPGRYVLNCPNGKSGDDSGRLVVSGKRHATQKPSPLLANATTAYRGYIERETAALVAGVQRLDAALRAGDLVRAKALFGPVRSHYEAIEPVAESFGNLDPAIDARIDDVPSEASWTGFHRIEKTLWVDGTTAGTAALGSRLVADVQDLQRRVRTLELQPAQLANGAVELLNEVASSKITGEEDRYSHTDLSDFAANLAGAQKAFALLRPALAARGDGALGATIARRFTAVSRTLDTYRRATPSGYASYDALTAADRRLLAQEVDALAEPLSTVAARVTGRA